MNDLFAALGEFSSGSNVGVYLFIFFGKILEVAVSTLRIVLINRGERIKGTLIAVIEILLWIIVTGTVLNGYQEDFIKVIVFCIAFACGNFIGSWLEERLAFGLCSIQAVVADKNAAKTVAAAMRQHGFGVSMMEVQGIEGEKHYMLISTLKRKLSNEAMNLIKDCCPNAVLTVSDVKTIKGGYLRSSTVRRSRRLGK